MAETVLVVDAHAGNAKGRGRQRGQGLEIGDEQLGLLGKRKLPHQVQRLTAIS
jgi:hypothetical protein